MLIQLLHQNSNYFSQNIGFKKKNKILFQKKKKRIKLKVTVLTNLFDY